MKLPEKILDLIFEKTFKTYGKVQRNDYTEQVATVAYMIAFETLPKRRKENK